ncbi:MAG: GEVED domain-containing protein [Bacteroidota bacterium]
MMSVDPSDDKTFWYTNEYLGNYSNWSPWITQIASFSIGVNYAASGGCDEYISRVQVGTINNITGCSGYGDYTLTQSTDLPANISVPITVTNGNGYSGDQCGIWIDWNRNGIFTDAGEQLTVSGQGGAGPYTATIIPPAGQTLGNCIMRIRIAYTGGLDPCGTYTYGEVEDYTINVTAKAPNYWTGTFNHYWHNASNWSLGHIPVADENAVITNAGYQPVLLSIFDDPCLDLTIQTGGTLQVMEKTITINGNLSITGTLGLTDPSGVINCLGNVEWNAGSAANFSAGGVFWVNGNWNFNTGSSINLTNGFVDFTGTGISWIRSYGTNCALPTVGIYKAGANWARVSNVSTQPLTINGNLYIQPSCNFGSSSFQDVIFKNSLINNGIYDFTGGLNTGTVVFDGTSQTINHGTTGTGLFNNVRFSSSTGTTALSNITVAKNLTIDQGTFSPGSTTVTVGGDWANTVGPTGFTAGTSRVIFNGPGHQYVNSSETFNILEANMGAALRVNNAANTVTCNQYDWTSGGIDVLSGTFTALDLLDNGISGWFYCNPGGTINLTNSGTNNWVDLNGELHIYGGNVNVYGGVSDWPYSHNAVIEMSGGVLDFHTCGIHMNNNGYTLTNNITGGTIRTAYGFASDRADFTPGAGTFEFYGPSDALLSQSNGSTLYYVNINKVSKDGSFVKTVLPVSGDRIDKTAGKGGKGYSASLSSDFTITNALTITSGALNVGAYSGSVAKYIDVYGTLSMADPLSVLNVGTIQFDNLRFYSGSTGSLSNGNIYLKSWILVDPGASFNASVNNTINIVGSNAGGGLACSEPTALFGNVGIFKSSGPAFLASDYTGPYTIQGNLTLHPANSFQTGTNSLHINGTINDVSGSSVYLMYSYKSNNSQYTSEKPLLNDSLKSGDRGGSLTIDSDFTLNGALVVSDGNALVHGRFAQASTGALSINGGSFIADSPNHPDKGWEYLGGNLTMPAGLFEITHNSIEFTSSATTNVSGGTLRTGGAFAAVNTGNFLPTGGIVEVTGNEPDVQMYCGNGNFFYDLLINRAPGTMSYLVWYNIIVKNDLTIQSGIFGCSNYNINVGRNWTNNVGPAGFVEGTGTVVFDGPSPSDLLTSETFYNLSVNKTYPTYDGLELFHDVAVTNDFHVYDGCVKFRSPANLTVTGNFTIDPNAGVNAMDGYGPHINIGKDWTNGNTGYTTDFGFGPGSYSVVTFNGTADQNLTTAASQEDFNTLVVNKASGRFRPQDNIKCFGDIQIPNGSWEDNASGLTHSVYKNFTVAATGSFLNAYPLNTVEFDGTQPSLLTYSSGIGYFHHLTINKSPGISVTQVGNTSCQFGGNLSLQQGIYTLNGYSLSVFGIVNINNQASLLLPPASLFIMSEAQSLNVNNGGTLQITGTSGSPVTMRANLAASRYNLLVNSGGTIAADYCTFQNVSFGGISVQAGATVNPAHAFKGCTFKDGGVGGSLLALSNNQVMTVRNAIFPANTWSGNYNASKGVNQGHVYFVDYTGAFSGEAYDYDPYNLVDWVPTLVADPTAVPGSVCPSSGAQLNANVTGGLTPYATYSWTPTTGLNNPNIATPIASPAVTTTYTVVVTDALGTTASDFVTVTVTPNLPVSVTIAASMNPVPPSTYVTFTATPVNGGTTPSYQWKVNGGNVGTGGPTYSYLPAYNDQVTCVLNSNYPCVTGNPAHSNTITMIVVATNATVMGIVPSPLTLCFDASNTVTVAGGGNTFLVQSGGHATIIAGSKISILYGAKVESGGYLHGYITTTNAYCGGLPPAFMALTSSETEQLAAALSPGFSIFPNPATGRFTLLQKGENADGIVRVEILGMYGELYRNETLVNERAHEFIVSDLAVGLYLVKVVKDGKVEVFKLILTR